MISRLPRGEWGSIGLTAMSYLTIAFLTAVNFLNYLDRYILAAVLPLISKDLLLTNEQSGRLVSAFVVGYFIFSPIFGYVGDRFSRPVLMAFGVLCWSVATLASGMQLPYLSLLCVRIFVGIGEASFTTIAPGYIKDRIADPAKLSRVLSFFFAAIPVGAALGYALAGVIAARWSWHAVFFVGAIPGFIAAAFLMRLPEHRGASPTGKEPLGEGFREIFSRPVLLLAIAGYALQTFTLTAIAAFITKYGVTLSFSTEEISALFGGILVVSGLVGTLVGGQIAASGSARRKDPVTLLFRIAVVSSFLAAPFLAAAFLVESKVAFLVLCFLAEITIFASTAPVNSLIILLSPQKYLTLSQGVTIATINLFGAMLGPILVGLAADYTSLGLGLQLTTTALVAAGIVWAAGGALAHRRGEALPDSGA